MFFFRKDDKSFAEFLLEEEKIKKKTITDNYNTTRPQAGYQLNSSEQSITRGTKNWETPKGQQKKRKTQLVQTPCGRNSPIS